MKSWTYSFHRFDSAKAYAAALAEIGWDEFPPDATRVAVDVVGILYEPAEQTGADQETGEPVFAEPIAKAGWHVNAAWRGVEMPAAFAAAQIHPATPERLWA